MSRPTNAIRNSVPGIRNPAAIGIRNPSSTNKESGIQYVESRIHSVESRIKDFLGLPCIIILPYVTIISLLDIACIYICK